VRGVAPHRGEHNAEVLAEWLGLDGARTRALREAGVLSADADRVP
jgi:crotonobetainyl-CoA:carnitine CoA-transferase CaiB-like acyl-CoA transferase